MVPNNLPGFTAEATIARPATQHAGERLVLTTDSDVVVPQLTCSCDPPDSGGRTRCSCCHINRQTFELYCFTTGALTA